MLLEENHQNASCSPSPAPGLNVDILNYLPRVTGSKENFFKEKFRITIVQKVIFSLREPEKEHHSRSYCF